MEMKKLLLCCCFLPGYLIAQNVYPREEVKGATLQVLEKEYPTAQGTAGDIEKGVSAIFGRLFSGYSKQGVLYAADVFIKAGGKVDEVIYSVTSDHLPADSVWYVMQKQLPPLLAAWQPAGVTRNVRVSVMGIVGKVRMPRKVRSDSVTLSTVEELQMHEDTQAIQKINLSGLELGSVPAVIYRFPNLEELDVSGCGLEKLDLDVKRLPKLRMVNVSNNQLTEWRISRNKSIAILNIQGTGLKRIPKEIGGCKGLSSVWLGFNTGLDLRRRDFRRIRRVRDLNLYRSELTALPRSIRRLRKLEVLDLYHNQLTALPSGLTRLRRLSHLAVSNNQLTYFPDNMQRLRRLQFLYAHHNRLSWLPEAIGRLENLEVVDIGYNWFSVFPAALLNLRHLGELDISANNFNAFPPELLQMQGVGKLYMRGNPFLEKQAAPTDTVYLEALKREVAEVYH